MNSLRSWSSLALVAHAAVAMQHGARRSSQREAVTDLFLPGELLGNIGGATVIDNNLGDQGPWPGPNDYIKMSNAGTVGSTNITVIIQNLTEYVPSTVAQNGRGFTNSSKFGFVSLSCNNNVTLRYTFYDSDSTAVEIETVYLSFYDVDSGNKEQLRELVGAITTPEAFYLYNGTELKDITVDGAAYAWRSSVPGNGADNPDDPMILTEHQKRRVVTLKYVNVSAIDVMLGVTYKDGCNGRPLMWSFKSVLAPPKPPTPAPTPPTPSPTLGECSTCTIWGDPHIITFKTHQKRAKQHPLREEFFRTREWKSDELTVVRAGTFYLVKNEQLEIQALYERNETAGATYMSAIALSGPLLEGNLLVIRPLEGKTTWAGKEILQSMPSTFENELVQARYHRAAKMVKDGTNGPGIDLRLPQGVTLTVNRWRHSLAAEIGMCPTEDQVGQCGSFTQDSF